MYNALDSLFCRMGAHYKQEQCVSFFFSDQDITCRPFLVFTNVNMQSCQMFFVFEHQK